MLEEIRRAKKKTTKKIQNKSKRKKQTNKQSHLVHPIKEMNGKKIKAIQKENEIRKAVSRTLRWRLRIKLQKDNTDKQPTVSEDNTVKQPTVPEENT
jgi:seryl-tRNA synthetase